MRYPLLTLTLAISSLFCAVAPAQAQVSIGVNIGINVPTYPRLVPVPGYPVYYDPRADSNYFFYDGMYWVFQNDDWYSSTWYNGPWRMTDRQYVPLYVLRVPVRYYRQAPSYFRGWQHDEPPRWGERWGHEWEQRHPGWDRWNRRDPPKAAPLPSYQREYSGERYPRGEEQQHELRSNSYRYQPREDVTRQHFQQEQRQQQDKGRDNRGESRGRDHDKKDRDGKREERESNRP